MSLGDLFSLIFLFRTVISDPHPTHLFYFKILRGHVRLGGRAEAHLSRNWDPPHGNFHCQLLPMSLSSLSKWGADIWLFESSWDFEILLDHSDLTLMGKKWLKKKKQIQKNRWQKCDALSKPKFMQLLISLNVVYLPWKWLWFSTGPNVDPRGWIFMAGSFGTQRWLQKYVLSLPYLHVRNDHFT